MSTPRIELPKGQNWLIGRMRAAGYQSSPEGVCFGIAYMGMQAILAKDTKSFDARLKIISEIRRENFDKQKIDLNVRAFFDGIELYQQPELYPFLFEEKNALKSQDALRTFPLTLSLALEGTKGEEKKGSVVKASQFSGIYNKKELADYFASLSKIIEYHSNMTHPFAFTLNCADHSIAVGYDPVQKQWLLINANRLPTEQIANADTLVERVISAFKTDEVTAFSSEIYVADEDYDALNKAIHIWQAQESWKTMHIVSSMKAQAKDSRGGSWLFIAARMGDVETVNALLQNPRTNPNEARIFGGATPLSAAASKGDRDVVIALLKDKRTNPNQALTDGTTPLYLAAQNGHREVVSALLEDSRVNPNQPTSEGATPLFIAAQDGLLDVVQLLLNKNVDMTIAFTSDIESLREFAKDHQVEQNMEVLINQKKQNGSTSDIAITPIEIAEVMGHLEIVELLKKALQSPGLKTQGFFTSPSVSSALEQDQQKSSLQKK